MSNTYIVLGEHKFGDKSPYKDIGIYSITDFNNKTFECSDKDNLIINCGIKLTENGKIQNRLDFYGISFIQKLRREFAFKGKVLFLSSLSEQDILTSTVNGAIIQAIGHSILNIMTSEEDWLKELEGIEPLDDLSLYDIQNHFCGIREILSEEIHHLCSKIPNSNEITNDFKASCKILLKRFDVTTKLKLDEYNSAEELLDVVKNACLAILPDEEKRDLTRLMPKWNWRILWLDDELKTDESNILLEELTNKKERNIKVDVVRSYEEATLAWGNNKLRSKDYAFVISDYRLNDAQGCRQKQGYHFLKDIAYENTGAGLMVYSGLTRNFLMQSFKHYGIQLSSFSKIDFNPADEKSANFLADEITRLGDESWELMNNRPSGTEWDDMKETYFKFKSSPEFYRWNQEATVITKKNIEFYKNGQSGMFEVKNSKFSTAKTGEEIERLKNILLGRRFAVAILAKDYLKSEDLIFTKKQIGDYIYTNSGGTSEDTKRHDYIFNKLALEVKVFPNFLLQEEYAWLRYDCEINLDDDVNVYWQYIDSIKSVFATHLSKSNTDFWKSELFEGILDVKPKLNVYFEEDVRPVVRSIGDVYDILNYFYKKLEPKAADYDQHLKEFVGLWRAVLNIIYPKADNPPFADLYRKLFTNFKAKGKSEMNALVNEKRVMYLDEEYSSRLAPWEFRVARNHRGRDSHTEIIKTYKAHCLKAVHDEIFAKTYEGNPVVPFFKIWETCSSKTVNSENLNSVILYCVHESNKERNERIRNYFINSKGSIGTSDDEDDDITKVERKKAKVQTGEVNTAVLPNHIFSKLKNQIDFSKVKAEGDFFKHYTMEEFQEITESIDAESSLLALITNYKDIVIFRYSEEDAPSIAKLTNNISDTEDLAIIGY